MLLLLILCFCYLCCPGSARWRGRHRLNRVGVWGLGWGITWQEMLGGAKVVLFKAALPAGVSTSVVHVALTRLLGNNIRLLIVKGSVVFTCMRQSRRFPWPWLLPSSSSASCLLGLSRPLANSRFTDNWGPPSSESSRPGDRADPGPELAGDPPLGDPSRAFFIGGWLALPPIESFFFGTVCRLPSLEA